MVATLVHDWQTEHDIEKSQPNKLEIFSHIDSMDWPLLFFKKMVGKPTREILKNKHCGLPVEYENASNEDINELSFLPESKKLAALCTNEGVLYADDTTRLPISHKLAENPELQEYCCEKNICLYDIDNHLVVAASDYHTIRDVNHATQAGLFNLDESPLRDLLENNDYNSVIVIGACAKHTQTQLKKLEATIANDRIELQGVYAPLRTLLQYVKERSYAFVKVDIDLRGNKLHKLEVFEHGASYINASVLDRDDSKLGFALKTLDNQCRAIAASANENAWLKIAATEIGLTTYVRSYGFNVNDTHRRIIFELIDPVDDESALPQQIGGNRTTSTIRQHVQEALNQNKPVVICVPRSQCIRYGANIILNESIRAQKAGGHNIAVNSDYFRYEGTKLLQIPKSHMTEEAITAHQFLSAIAFGALVTTNDINHAEKAVENLQNIITITHASKAQLPENLQKFAEQV